MLSCIYIYTYMNKKPVCVCVAQREKNKQKSLFDEVSYSCLRMVKSTKPTIYILLKILLQYYLAEILQKK